MACQISKNLQPESHSKNDGRASSWKKTWNLEPCALDLPECRIAGGRSTERQPPPQGWTHRPDFSCHVWGPSRAPLRLGAWGSGALNWGGTNPPTRGKFLMILKFAFAPHLTCKVRKHCQNCKKNLGGGFAPPNPPGCLSCHLGARPGVIAPGCECPLSGFSGWKMCVGGPRGGGFTAWSTWADPAT